MELLWGDFFIALAGALVGGGISWLSAKHVLKGTIKGAQKLWADQRAAQLSDYSRQNEESQALMHERKRKTAAILHDDMLLAFEIALSADKHIRIPPMNKGDYKVDLRDSLCKENIIFINRFFVFLDSIISRHKFDGSENRIRDLYNHFYKLVFQDNWDEKVIGAENKSYEQVKGVLGNRFLSVMKEIEEISQS